MTSASPTTVFTTVLVQRGQPKWLDEHFARISEHAGAFSINCPDYELLRREIYRIAEFSPNCLVRIEFGRGCYSVAPRPFRAPSQDAYEHGAQVIITDVQVETAFAPYKTGNRLSYEKAREVAEVQGAFEGLLLDSEGFVVDGSRSSPLMFCNDALISLEGGMRGITREKVLEAAQDLGLRIRREKLRAGQLDGLLLVAGSGIGLVPNGRYDDEKIKTLIELFQLQSRGN